MKRLVSLFTCAIVVLFLMVGCATLMNLISPAHYKTFELTISEQKVVVNLPNELPSMDKAISEAGGCWDAKLCMTSFCINDEPKHGHVRFFHSGNNVVALVWCPPAVKEGCRHWLYLKGIPVEVKYDKLQKFLDSIWMKVPK